MIFYRTILDTGTSKDWSHLTTLVDAHDAAKSYPYTDYWAVRIEQIDVDTSRDGILDLLMGYDPTDSVCLIRRTWGITPRGGLVANLDDDTQEAA